MYIFQFYPITYTTSIISSKKNVAPKTSATYSTVIVRVLPTYHTYAIHLFCCLVDVFLSSSSHMCLFLCVYINVNCTESKKKDRVQPAFEQQYTDKRRNSTFVVNTVGAVQVNIAAYFLYGIISIDWLFGRVHMRMKTQCSGKMLRGQIMFCSQRQCALCVTSYKHPKKYI